MTGEQRQKKGRCRKDYLENSRSSHLSVSREE